MLTLLTTTGARPAAFAICERLMARQRYDGPVLWIVIDDGAEAQPLGETRRNWRRIVHRPKPYWRPGDNTQARNLSAGLDIAEANAAASGDALRLAVIEDDDWYHPDWLATLDAALDGADLAGECEARYYNAALRRGAHLGNRFHASLRSTGLRGAAIPALRRALETFSTCYDFKLWRDPAPSKRLFETGITVGVKGLPGRPGIAAGHRDIAGAPDPDLRLLRQWMGDDADIYAPFYREDLVMSDRRKMYATGRLKKYENRMLVAGDAFEVKEKDVRALRALKFATDDPPAPAPAPKPVPAGVEVPPDQLDRLFAKEADGEETPAETADSLSPDAGRAEESAGRPAKSKGRTSPAKSRA